MISSTAPDLPEHREKVMHACLRLGMFSPEIVAFDEAKFEPMPEAEIDPEDEFGAGSERTGGD
jgi:hypothetical protein